MASTTAARTSRSGSIYRGGEGMDLGTATHHRRRGVLLPARPRSRHRSCARLPNSYDLVIASYKTPIVNLLEVGLVGAVLYHALNGIRIILVDFWSKGPRYQKQMTWAIGIIWVVLMVPGAYFMLLHTIESLFGSSS